MNEYDALLDSIDQILAGAQPAQVSIDQIRGVISRARQRGNLDDSIATEMLKQTGSPQHTNGILEALEDAILRARKACAPDTPPSAPSPPAQRISSRGSISPRTSVTASGPRETAFQRCFPLHTKYFTYSTQKPSLLRRSKSTFTTAISPDTLHFVICSKTGRYTIYSLPSDLDDGPSVKFQGQLPLAPHYFVECNNDWAVIASAQGKLHTISLETGREIWTYDGRFGARALCVSPTGAYIALSVCTQKDGGLQPIVLLLCPDPSAEESKAFSHVVEIPFVCPYRDAVRCLAFSPDELNLMCSTDRDSRFFIVSLLDPKDPRLVMRSSRKVPHEDPAYEGITDVQFFPRRSCIVVTSMAKNSPPILLDPRLNQVDSQGQSLSSNSSRSQSHVLLRADKVGARIHSSTVSPRENAVAFLDQCGLVYVMFWPKQIDHHKKCVVVFELASAPSVYDAASLQFSEDGTVLYAVDRKGCLHIADFGAGMPQSAGISNLRVLT